MTSDNNNPWDEPTRWDSQRPADDAPTGGAAVTPPPLPPTPPADLPVFGTPTPPPAPTPAAATPPPTPPTGVPSMSPAPGSAIGSQPIPTMSAAPPAGAPVLTGNYGGTDAPIAAAPTGSSGNGRFVWIAAIVGAIALLGGGAFFALTAFGASGGGETPEDAVDQMLVAINGEDFITIGELLDPAERRTIVEPMLTGVLPELERLGVFDESLDPADVEGVDFELADVDYRIEPLADDLQAVYFTSGTASSSSTAADFPWGDAIRERFADDLEDSPRTTESIEDDATPLVLVERDGRWYFSMWHSIAEQARLESGDALPLIGDQPVRLGTETPAAAVEAMITELVDLDLRSAIGRMDPTETAALYRYSPIFLGEAEGELNAFKRDAAAEGITWSIADMDFDVDEDGDDAVVTIRAFTFTFTTPDVDVVVRWSREQVRVDVNAQIDGESVSGYVEITPSRWTVSGTAAGESVEVVVDIDAVAETITLSGNVAGESIDGRLSSDPDGVCSEFSFTGPDIAESGCLEELLDEAGVDSSLTQLQLSQLFGTVQDEYPGVPMAAHRVDGSWYVSPTMSIMNAVTTGLADLSRSDFNTFLDGVEESSEGFTIEDILDAPFDAVDGVTVPGSDPDPFDVITDDEPIFEDPLEPETSETFTAAPTSEPSYVQGILANNQSHRYTVAMEAGQTLGATLYGTDIDGGIGDPLLWLEDPSGFEVAYNDDADGLNSAFLYTATTSGDHVIVVRELGGRSGAYELGFELDDEGSTPVITGNLVNPVDPIDPNTGGFELIAVPSGLVAPTGGATLNFVDFIEANTYDVWDLVVETDVQLAITVLGEPGTEVDPNVTVIGLDGTEFGYNDDAAPEAGLENFYDSYLVVDLPAGTYTLEVHSFGDNDTGEYELIVAVN